MDNVKCGLPSHLRFTWPGYDELHACVFCAAKIKRVADAMGFPLQLIASSDHRPCECLVPPDASR